MSRLNACEREVINVMAHVMMALELDRNVEGMAGFAKFYLDGLTPKQRHIWESFKKRLPEVKKDMAKLLKDGMESTHATP